MQKSSPYKLLHGPLFYQTVFRSGIRSPGDVFVINIQKSSVHLYQQRQFNIDERKFTYILRPGITPNRDYWRVVYHTNTLLSDRSHIHALYVLQQPKARNVSRQTRMHNLSPSLSMPMANRKIYAIICRYC